MSLVYVTRAFKNYTLLLYCFSKISFSIQNWFTMISNCKFILFWFFFQLNLHNVIYRVIKVLFTFLDRSNCFIVYFCHLIWFIDTNFYLKTKICSNGIFFNFKVHWKHFTSSVLISYCVWTAIMNSCYRLYDKLILGQHLFSKPTVHSFAWRRMLRQKQFAVSSDIHLWR